jgi:hypothetical protein
MNIEVIRFNNEHYAANLVQVGNLLKWDAIGATHYLIIRSMFGTNIEFSEDDKNSIEQMENDQIFSKNEMRYMDNRFFAFNAKSTVNNYSYTISPARYAVYGCEYNEITDICKLYQTNDACQYQCDVYSSIKIQITYEETKKRFFEGFHKSDPKKNYYIMNIPSMPRYVDGDLRYTFDGCKYKYPITKEMLGKSINIPSYYGKSPKVEGSSSNGYVITTNK